MQEQRRKKVYRPLGQDLDILKVSCWCGCQTVGVPAEDVRNGVTGSCGRRLCTALGYSQVLTAAGEPCDCKERG